MDPRKLKQRKKAPQLKAFRPRKSFSRMENSRRRVTIVPIVKPIQFSTAVAEFLFDEEDYNDE